jgi:hypothetical protein
LDVADLAEPNIRANAPSLVPDRYCISVGDVADDYIASVTQKNPKQKADTLHLLRDVVGTSSKKDVSRAAAALLPTLAKVAGEPAPDIRQAALQVTRKAHGTSW